MKIIVFSSKDFIIKKFQELKTEKTIIFVKNEMEIFNLKNDETINIEETYIYGSIPDDNMTFSISCKIKYNEEYFNCFKFHPNLILENHQLQFL